MERSNRRASVSLKGFDAYEIGLVAAKDGVPIRVLTYPLVTTPEGDLVGHLQLAASLETVENARQLVLTVLLVGGILAVGFAALIGWSTAAAALRPINQVTATALQITRADDLSRRIPQRGPPRDEVGHLIVAFNETLERLERVYAMMEGEIGVMQVEKRIRNRVKRRRLPVCATSPTTDRVTGESG